ncbi:type II toxin-antitoxin system VapC family toxin [Serpentinimonas maccroryi]|uniref:type II toxin-antitoxin system VapC family toxin n=1 Tax=Serpentinimonas maccroryi TaxID=1458426 RepID=UPI0020337A6C|nr:type II toxin-antitoxin system VapC family toxin [Serpentinimonas maccroryi]MCM2477942.1 type II toxin-antitoxin system VapC family toxin [Serpentinimonas maccroryi]
MKYLLDTCTVSDFVKGQAGVMARLKATSPKLIVVSALTRMEIDYGLALNSARARKLAPVLDALFSVVGTVPFNEADAQATAAIRAALKLQGRPIGAYDALIAGTGVARGLIVVTSNVSEFNRVSGLQVENWR